MKIPNVAIAAALLLQTLMLEAQEPKAEGPAPVNLPPSTPTTPSAETPPGPALNVLVELQMVAVPLEAAPALIRELTDKEKIEAAYGKIQEMIAQGTATLVGWPMIISKSGQRAVFEAIHEFRYVAEYAPAGIGVYHPEKPEDPKGSQTEEKRTIFGTEFSAVPTVFETRNIGVTLEVEPVIAPDNRTISLTMIPQDIRCRRMTKITLERPDSAEKVIVEQPEFDTMKSQLSLTVKDGQRMLIGGYPTSDPANRLELFILHTQIQKVE